MNRGFLKNIIFNLLFKFAAVGYGFYTTKWLIDYLSAESYKEYNVILALTGAILPFINFGIPALVQKEYTNNKNQEELYTVWSSFALVRSISYILGLLAILLLYRLTGSSNIGLIISIFSIQFLILADEAYRSICDAQGRSWQYSLTDFLGKTIVFGGLFMAAQGYLRHQYTPIIYFIFVSLGANTFAILLDSIINFRFTRLFKPSFGFIRSRLKSITQLALATVAIGLYLTTDKLFLQNYGYGTLTINGYANAYKLFEVGMVVPGITMTIIASYVKKNLDSPSPSRITTYLQKRFPKLERRTIHLGEGLILSLGLGILTMIATMVISTPALNIIDAESKYPLAHQILPILAISYPGHAIMLLLTFLTIFLHGEKVQLYSTLITAGITLLIYSVSIYYYGAFGAAWSTVAMYMLDASIKFVFFKRIFRKYKNIQPESTTA